MIRVAFLFTFSKDYKGGINYLKNLFYATQTTGVDDLEFYFFFSSDAENDITDLFAPYATIVKTDILKKHTLKWFINKLFVKLFNRPVLLFYLLKKYKIDVISHSWFTQKTKSIKLLNWIPDFQNLHFPGLWSEAELQKLNAFNDKLIKSSDLIVLSSNDAFEDFKKVAPTETYKTKILQFVSQPGELTEKEIIDNSAIIAQNYKIGEEFFYLPNQFWSHKDHMTAFKAINILVKKGLNPILVTTGVMNDSRGGGENILTIRKFIQDNNLSKNIILLGVIPYEQVLTLMRTCLAVVNPSLFEGWSSTVEEAKSIGKTIVLSNINVHKEQAPNCGIYFDKKNESQLADILEDIWLKKNKSISQSKEDLANDLLNRTKKFGYTYYLILKELVGKQ